MNKRREIKIYHDGKLHASFKEEELMQAALDYESPGWKEIEKAIMDCTRKGEEKIFIEALRINAVPPIKGEITKGKIKWRGIRIVQGPFGVTGQMTKQLFQRKTPISPAVYIF